MKKILSCLILILTLIIGIELSYAQDNGQNVEQAKKIKAICTEYYNEGVDCPYDDVNGVPVMINGDDYQDQRFDDKDEVEIEKPQFKSN